MKSKKSKTATNGKLPLPFAEVPHAFLIRIPERADRLRAIVAFLHVPRTSCRFKDNQFLVTREHLEALENAGIPFEDITGGS